MHLSVRWLVALCAERGLCSESNSLALVDSLPDKGADLMVFAQALIDQELVLDLALLETLAGKALSNAQQGIEPPLPLGEQTPSSTARSSACDPFPFAAICTLPQETLTARFRELLRQCGADGVSDLHLSSGARPYVKKHRSLQFLDDAVLSPEQALRINTLLLDDTQVHLFKEKKDYDYALSLREGDRFRVNLMMHRQGAAGAYRMVPSHIRTLPELGFADHMPALERMLSFHNGLILVTGPVGAGKTTTLAAMVDYLNRSRSDHIITVEDPIEVVQAAHGCNVTQREVGRHTRDFYSALKGALREDPDIIVIGELRDLETIDMAITASETGHLVIGTMHTSDAATTLNRLLDVFPPGQQPQIRASVAESLRGVLCQRLLPSEDGGLVLACELLVNNTAVSNLIRENKSSGLRNTMETGLRDGMCLMDASVFSLWEQNRISAATASANISNRILRLRVS